MKGCAKTVAMRLDERPTDDDVALIPVFINGSETLACITVREARNRGVLTLAKTGEAGDLSMSELKAHMKEQLCELLILEKMLRPAGS